MSITTTGLEWNRFYSDVVAWPEGAYHDDTVVLVKGASVLDLGEVADSAIVEIKEGSVIFADDCSADLVSHFAAWLKGQDTVCGAFEVSKENFEAVKAAIIAAGGAVVFD